MRWEIAAPSIALLLYRAYSHSSLTTPALITAGLTATIHALHPSPLPFTLLGLFFLVGTAATKVKKDVKATLTLSSTGSHTRSNSGSGSILFSTGWNKSSEAHEQRNAARHIALSSDAGGQDPRSTVQVLANSGFVSLLCLVHIYTYGYNNTTDAGQKHSNIPSPACFGAVPARDILLAGIIANYAAVTADTLSSELGILSPYKPRSILSLKEVPPGTNGGITGLGLGAGLAGALFIGLVSLLLLPVQCEGTVEDKLGFVLAVGGWGAMGSVLDSVLGATCQATVVDKTKGKVVEAPNGGRVLVRVKKEKSSDEVGHESKPSRVIGTGRDILDNNQVNFVMAGVMSVGGMLLAGRAWGVPISVLWTS